jgi:hypothetical protein
MQPIGGRLFPRAVNVFGHCKGPRLPRYHAAAREWPGRVGICEVLTHHRLDQGPSAWWPRRARRAALRCLAAGLLAGGAWLAGPARAADGPALITIVEGPALLIDGARSLQAAAGLRLGAATLIETAPSAQLLRVEFNDGSLLDLGPDTKAMVLPPGLAGAGPKAPAFYLLQGWAKHTGDGTGKSGGLLSYAAEGMQATGTTVSRVTADGLQLFVETGKLQVLERRVKPPNTVTLKAGEFYTREGADKGQVSPRPASGFLPSVPRAFRDTIPSRAAALKGRRVDPQAGPVPGYAALKPWLTAEPVIRREFPRRFGPLAKDAAFRDGLVKNLAAHREWEPVLFPKPPASNPTPTTPYLRPDSPRS